MLHTSIVSIATKFSCNQVLLKFLLQVLLLPFFYNIHYFDYISSSYYLFAVLILVFGHAYIQALLHILVAVILRMWREQLVQCSPPWFAISLLSTKITTTIPHHGFITLQHGIFFSHYSIATWCLLLHRQLHLWLLLPCHYFFFMTVIDTYCLLCTNSCDYIYFLFFLTIWCCVWATDSVVFTWALHGDIICCCSNC